MEEQNEEENTLEIVEEKGGPCDRCGKAIELHSDAVICTHFGSLPTISHQACARRNFAHTPSVGLKFGVRYLPFFLIVNVLNFLIGVIALYWGLFELTKPQDANTYTPTFPIGLMFGPFMIGIGGVLVARIQHLSKRVPKRRY